MYFDTGVPRWSSWMLNNVIEGVLSVPQGAGHDLLKAMWQMLSDGDVPLVRGLAQFTRDTVRNFLVRQRKGLSVDLSWLLPWPDRMTPTQAYFAYNVLALAPDLFAEEIEQKIAVALKGSDFYSEVFPGA
jgi:hypothetical protein